MRRFTTTRTLARGRATALVVLALSLGGTNCAHAFPGGGGAGGAAAGAGAPGAASTAPATQAGGAPVGVGIATPTNPTGAPQAGVGAPTTVNPTGTITPAGGNPAGNLTTGTSTSGNPAGLGTPNGIGMVPPSALSLTPGAAGSSAGNPALNPGSGAITNGVPNSTAIQSSNASQFGPGMNPQFGPVPGTLGTSSSTYGYAPNPSQMGSNNYGPYGQNTPNAAANFATNSSRNWGGPTTSWQPGYGSWSSGYSPPSGGGTNASSNWNTGFRGFPGSTSLTNAPNSVQPGGIQPNTYQQPFSTVPTAPFGVNGASMYEMNNQGPLAFRRSTSPYNSGAFNNSVLPGGYSYGSR